MPMGDRALLELYRQYAAPSRWEGFEPLMKRLGFVNDQWRSFGGYRAACRLQLKEPVTRMDEFNNKLRLLEHADLQVVGNYLYTQWDHLTRCRMRYDKYDICFLQDVVGVLEKKLYGDDAVSKE